MAGYDDAEPRGILGPREKLSFRAPVFGAKNLLFVGESKSGLLASLPRHKQIEHVPGIPAWFGMTDGLRVTRFRNPR
ncbi:MAG: hypothetical protein DMG30_23755 [Acidobacteria bacterium]|nr:MAG: hypothetical protein DMG30_23755 [Acidobacteriota bacterium]